MSVRNILSIVISLCALGGVLVSVTAYVVRTEFPSADAVHAERLATENSHRITTIEKSLNKADLNGRLSRLEAQSSALLRQSELNQARLDKLLDIIVERHR